MKAKIILAGAVLVAALGTAGTRAQAQDPIETGRVISGPIFDGGRQLLFSQNDFIYGTARSAAMGGAFTSLGADLSSMSINPAGLGMYQSSDWGFTTALSIDRMNTASPNMRQSDLLAGGSRTSFGFNNVGAAFNVYSGSGNLTSFTLGFAYNRVANFNSRTEIVTTGNELSIAQMFARQLNWGDGFTAGFFDNNPFENTNYPLQLWGAALGYQTFLVNPEVIDGRTVWFTDPGTPAIEKSTFNSLSKGGMHEYDFSLGGNISNYFYFGATISATDINYSEETSYGELYADPDLGSLKFNQNTNVRGGGVTAKLGIVARPVEALRIGVAFHLPTWYSIEKAYTGKMETNFRTTGTSSFNTGTVMVDELRFSTAPKLLVGVSGVIADRAIVALDWDMTMYNLIRMNGLSIDEAAADKADAESRYKPAHTLRAGAEFLVSDNFSVRAGAGYMMDFTKDENYVKNNRNPNPAGRDGFNITGGFGISLGRNGYLDMAYVYNRTRMTDYEMFYFDDHDTFTAQPDASGNARYYTPTRNHHMVTLTLGTRF
jgi:hypothetical protein